MKYISLFSGIEAATVAWRALGWQAAAFAEIEPFCCAVLAHHYPQVPNLGDVKSIKKLPAADVLIGGSPCQSFSQAGNRKGLKGESGLVREFIRLSGVAGCRWIIWENVPGAISSGGGEDFAYIVAELQKCGYSCAWRVLDARFFGVPQRRRRLYLIGYLEGEAHLRQYFLSPKGAQGILNRLQKKQRQIRPGLRRLLELTISTDRPQKSGPFPSTLQQLPPAGAQEGTIC